jgi:serine-type D-Ala-D-Ala carboxypeptidase (penicillin-binding protein 5/6)
MLRHRTRTAATLTLIAIATLPLNQAAMADSPAKSSETSRTVTSSSAGTVAKLTIPAKLTVPGAKKKIPWPGRGRARLQVVGIGELGHSGKGTRVPIASVTKVMTAYLVLRDHPLASGANGPRIRVTRAEAKEYARRKAAGETVVKVVEGERITERQALQAVLIPSGNNMADILARWDAGSKAAFVRKMNKTAKRLKMTSTHYADASGLSSKSRSTTADLLKLARVAMADRTFATIVRQKSATVPYNRMKNTNTLLGRHGIIGIKTGFTTPAGGCLLFATTKKISGKTYTIYGAYLGAAKLAKALNASDKLVVAGRSALKSTTLIPAGRSIATVTTSSGREVKLAPAKNFRAVGWSGLRYTLSLPSGLRRGQIPTTLTARTSAGKVTVALKAV